VSTGGFPWGEIVDWLSDLIAFRGSSRTLGRRFPEVEAKDGQEPTAEFMCQQAREADARAKMENPRTLTSHDRKAIDKEFWDTM